MGRREELQVEFLREVLDSGGRIARANFSLNGGTLRRARPTFYLTLDQKGVHSLQEFPWSRELEEYLLFKKPQKMHSDRDEIERFAAILLNNVETAQAEFGRDYVLSVLVDVVRRHAEYPLSDVLDRTGAPTPDRKSPSYLECSRFLDTSINGLHNTALAFLGYKDAIPLLTEALRIVLDEQFHISARELLFGRTS